MTKTNLQEELKKKETLYWKKEAELESLWVEIYQLRLKVEKGTKK